VVDSGGDTTTDAAQTTTDAPVTTADASDAGTGPDAAPPVDAGMEAGPPVCSSEAGVAIGQGTFVLGTPDPDLLGAVTPDELVIAWTSLPSTGPVVYWAERASAGDSFGAPQALDSSYGPFPPEHVALSGDGLRLVFATVDHKQIVEVSRASRGTPFNAVTTTKDFNAVNPLDGGTESVPGIGPFASPALSGDFGIWAYVQGTNGVVVTKALAKGEWNTPPNLPSGLVPPASSAKTVIPTGWSSDRLTLFYWDTSAQAAVMAWLGRTSGVFEQTLLLGLTQQYAYPTGDCSRIYYSAPSPDAGADTLDIFVAPRN
jgi:hypothetical protein